MRDFIWAYRLAETFNDPGMREPMLHEGFQRLPRIQGREVSFEVEIHGTTETVETTLGELFRTDLAQALLLDMHVNVPGKIWTSDTESNLAINAAQSVFEDNGLTIPSIMSPNHDLQLIAGFMEARLGEMADPVGRAIGILKYTDTDVVEDLARVDAREPDQPIRSIVQDFLNESLLLDQHPDYDASTVWENIRQHERKVLTLAQP